MKSQRIILFLVLLLAGAIVLGACSTPPTAGPATSTEAPTAQPAPTMTTDQEADATSEEVAPVREGDESSATGTVSREQAEQAALEAVGSGQVTWSGPEDDRGAAWEVEITRPDGSEVDVLVAADGTVIKQVEKAGRGPALSGPGIIPSSGVVSRQEAAQAALDYVGEGRVTWIGREDERGAAWEVEITRPNGREIDVLVAPDGSIIQ